MKTSKNPKVISFKQATNSAVETIFKAVTIKVEVLDLTTVQPTNEVKYIWVY